MGEDFTHTDGVIATGVHAGAGLFEDEHETHPTSALDAIERSLARH
jgi:hypothetical protein